MPDADTKRRIFQIHTARMTLHDDVNLEELIQTKDDISGADVKVWSSFPVLHFLSLSDVVPRLLQAICTEAGLLALRDRRRKVTQDDFRKAKETALFRKKGNLPEGLYL